MLMAPFSAFAADIKQKASAESTEGGIISPTY
jgi:hypothetical protein